VSNKPTDTPTDKTPAHPEPVTQPPSIIQPIIDDLKGRLTIQQPQADEAAPPPGPVHPPQPARLDQDAGGGYNTNNTYPQK
jgi:hypothetical protein